MRNRRPAIFASLLFASMLLAPLARADDSPARRGPMINRLESRLNTLDLTPDQRKKVDTILDDTARKLGELREGADLAELREAAGEVFRETRTRLAGVLTADQLQQLEASMPRRMQDDAEDSPRSDAPKPDSPKAESSMTEGSMTEVKDSGMSEMKPGDTMMGESMTGDPMKGGPKTPEKSVGKSPPQSAADAGAGIAALVDERFAPGTPAPNFTLKNLDNKPVSLTKFRGKPTVLLFGSFTSPTFRDKIDAFDTLRKDYRNKANFIVIYTREAYPNNEWEVQRNIDDQIRVGQHTTIEERARLAKMTAEGLKIDMDVLIDDMDDGVARAYDAMPNGCVVLDAQGKILRKQKWADPFGVKLSVDEALRAR